MRHQSRWGWLLGFTIVEIMIVVILIGLVIAIAIPAIQRAQAQADRMQCQSHLRQIGIALRNYATAYNQALPTNLPGGEATIPYPPARTGPPIINQDISTNLIGTRDEPWGLGKLHEQLGDDLTALFCPRDGLRNAVEYRERFLTNRTLDGGDTVDCSYLYRGRDAPDPADTGGIRLFGATSDTARALVMDYYHAGMRRLYHDDRICILFEDGTTLDVRVSLGQSSNRFVDPVPGPGVPESIWRTADVLYEGDD